jgi:hypothetical protein
MIWCPPIFGGHFMHQSTALQKAHRNSRLPFIKKDMPVILKKSDDVKTQRNDPWHEAGHCSARCGRTS